MLVRFVSGLKRHRHFGGGAVAAAGRAQGVRWGSSRTKIRKPEPVERIERLMRAGLAPKPVWYDAHKRAPPWTGAANVKLPEIKFEETELLKQVLHAFPLLRLELDFWTPGEKTIAQRFAFRQAAFMKMGQTEASAFDKARAQFQEEIDAFESQLRDPKHKGNWKDSDIVDAMSWRLQEQFDLRNTKRLKEIGPRNPLPLKGPPKPTDFLAVAMEQQAAAKAAKAERRMEELPQWLATKGDPAMDLLYALPTSRETSEQKILLERLEEINRRFWAKLPVELREQAASSINAARQRKLERQAQLLRVRSENRFLDHALEFDDADDSFRAVDAGPVVGDGDSSQTVNAVADGDAQASTTAENTLGVSSARTVEASVPGVSDGTAAGLAEDDYGQETASEDGLTADESDFSADQGTLVQAGKKQAKEYRDMEEELDGDVMHLELTERLPGFDGKVNIDRPSSETLEECVLIFQEQLAADADQRVKELTSEWMEERRRWLKTVFALQHGKAVPPYPENIIGYSRTGEPVYIGDRLGTETPVESAEVRMARLDAREDEDDEEERVPGSWRVVAAAEAAYEEGLRRRLRMEERRRRAGLSVEVPEAPSQAPQPSKLGV